MVTINVNFITTIVFYSFVFCHALVYSQLDSTWISPFPNNNKVNCAYCHKKIFAEWKQSSHAKSAKNPWVLDIYNGTAGEGIGFKDWGPGYKRDFPNTGGNCAFCHVPTAAIRSPFMAELNRTQNAYPFRMFSNDDAKTNISGIDTCGILCDFCHRIQTSKYSELSHTPGVLGYTLSKLKSDVENRPCESRGYNSLIQAQSLFCAPCHTTQFWNVPIYDTYTEWKNSAYSKEEITCQDCHFKDEHGKITHKVHGPSDIDFLKDAIELKYVFFKSLTHVKVKIYISNIGVGHYFPSGSPFRNAILVVSAKDSLGNYLTYEGDQLLSEYSGLGPKTSDYAGWPGKIYAKVIENNPKSYCQPIIEETGFIGQDFPQIKDKNLYAFWNPSHIDFDTRIPPFSTDSLSFNFTLNPSQNRVHLNIQLIYRKVFKTLSIKKLWTDHDLILYNTSDIF